MSNKLKQIRIKKDTHKELSLLKVERECDSFDEVIRQVVLEEGNE